MSRKKKIRFAFTIQHGENSGLTSGSQRVWTSKEDTYLTSVSLGDTWKVSLHGEEAWRIAVTSEHMRSENPVLPPGEDRAPWKFSPTEWVHGRRLAFVLASSRGALINRPLEPADVHIAVEDRWDQITMAQIWMTEPGVDLPEGVRLIGGPLPLASGRRVWVTADTQGVPGKQEWTVASGIMAEPLLPQTHDVSAPGMLLRGVHVN
ncbi:hypothetical protein [Streptomyces sp. SH5]|uniref:hypothetical protein n=1 Tax=Streptomyces sp. SH5 TaxID=3041765 RepID=UPI002477E9E9|nr:hypothetical protein [Streptomyces sp. SH5]WGP12661.1 hypothetical protein QFA72_24820 [Streptomyces sp. SH5]